MPYMPLGEMRHSGAHLMGARALSLSCYLSPHICSFFPFLILCRPPLAALDGVIRIG
jgi:hypothetical protein